MSGSGKNRGRIIETMWPIPDPQRNRLLAALATEERERIFPALHVVELPAGTILYESGASIRYAYFPVDCVVSLLYVLVDGGTTAVSLVGNEGLIGIPLFMGGETTPYRAIVQTAGYALRLNAPRLKEEFHRSLTVQGLFLRYTQAVIVQMAQVAACNRHHSVDRRLACWLLLLLDRQTTSAWPLTQESLARMLGVRREGVTQAAGKLQAEAAIEYSRGRLTVLNRSRLEQFSCECYAAMSKETDRLLPPLPPAAGIRTPSAFRSCRPPADRRKR